jgi:5-methylcytosine-specific restriction endonuclease McrA
MSEYITCSRCGVVKRGHICPNKPYRKKERDAQVDKFRKSTRWTNKSKEIRQRDKYLCVVCMANRYNTIRQFNFDKLEVHHITPLAEDYNKRLDNDNLITLCKYHHNLAENGEIPREELCELISPHQIIK